MANNKTETSLQYFKRECEVIHEDINKELPKEKIYHYTDYDGLKGIIEKRRLRYTDYRYFNDPTELKYCHKIIKDLLVSSKLDSGLISILNRFLEETDMLCKIYICCFSLRIDKLSLWRYYANNGSGFAITFNRNFLTTDRSGSYVDRPLFGKVIYGKNNANTIVDSFVNKCTEALERTSNKQERAAAIEELALELIANLFSISPFFKDDSYEEECEARLVRIEGDLMRDPITGKPFLVSDEFREFTPYK